MKLITTHMPKMKVEFSHPDDNSAFYSFIIDDEGDVNIPSLDIAKLVWSTYNSSGYYHEMEITSELFIDGVEHTHVVYKGGNPEYAEGTNMKKIFPVYGELEYLEAKDFYAGDWSHYDVALDENGEKWSIAINGNRNDFRYGAW